MTTFIIIAALLVIVTVALLFLPMLKGAEKKEERDAGDLSMQVLREQLQEIEKAAASGQLDKETAEREKRELERRALEEAATDEGAENAKPLAASARQQRKAYLVAAIVAIPLLAGGLYWLLGSPESVAPDKHAGVPADPHGSGSHALNPEQIVAMTDKLAEKLATNPGDGEGWLMLGRSYAALGRHGESAAAYGRAMALLPPNPGYLADYADVLAMAQGRRLAGEPEKIIAKALSLDPNHIKSLALSGSAAFEKADYARAVSEWQKILLLVPADSNVAQSIRNSIADAQSRTGTQNASANSTMQSAAATGAVVGGKVELSAKFRNQVSPGDTVFIFARSPEGSRIPLALKRVTVADLPAQFTLDDSMAMSPNAKLSGSPQVVIGARVSKSGGATPRPGDFEGFSKPVKLGDRSVNLIIDTPVAQ